MVESTPLLRERGGDLTEGSNPSRSALTPIQFIWVGVRAFEGDEIPAHRAQGLNAAFASSEMGKNRAAQTGIANGNPSRSALTPIQFIWVGVRAFKGGTRTLPKGPRV